MIIEICIGTSFLITSRYYFISAIATIKSLEVTLLGSFVIFSNLTSIFLNSTLASIQLLLRVQSLSRRSYLFILPPVLPSMTSNTSSGLTRLASPKMVCFKAQAALAKFRAC